MTERTYKTTDRKLKETKKFSNAINLLPKVSHDIFGKPYGDIPGAVAIIGEISYDSPNGRHMHSLNQHQIRAVICLISDILNKQGD